MDIHTPPQTPEWKQKSPDAINIWQRFALTTHGAVTPGNITSVIGMFIVIVGAVRLYHGHWLLGLLLIALGRAADLVDGFVATRTGTKSRFGEIVDTTCDNVGVFVVVISVILAQTVPYLIIGPIALYHLYLALFALIWGRKYHLHTTRFGKLAMAASWVAILSAIVADYKSNTLAVSLSVVSFVVFIALALASIYTYWLSLKKVSTRTNEFESWTREVTAVVHLYNPHATNYHRAEKALSELCKPLKWKPQRFDITKQRREAEKFLCSSKRDQTLLITIAGGDGTVSGVVNMLIELASGSKLPMLYALPLWGGNANDFSYMLNGLYSTGKMHRLLSGARPVTLPCIQLNVTEKKKQRTVYACCYASFGASAFAARRLEDRRFSTSSMVRWFPPLLVLRELMFVARALIDSPLRVAEINSRETAFYEHTLINGSRIAKVNRVPVQIDEPVFFHALVERKHPSVVINLLRILFGRPDIVYTKRSKLMFTTKQPLDAQIDGEVMYFAPDTDISASITYPRPVLFISSNAEHK